MNRPSGVRAAETMTTGSEAVAMGGSSIFTPGRAMPLNDNNHMMRCKNYNGNEGIIYREGAGLGATTVIIRDSGWSSKRSRLDSRKRPGVLDARRSLSSGGALRRPVGGA